MGGELRGGGVAARGQGPSPPRAACGGLDAAGGIRGEGGTVASDLYTSHGGLGGGGRRIRSSTTEGCGEDYSADCRIVAPLAGGMPLCQQRPRPLLRRIAATIEDRRSAGL